MQPPTRRWHWGTDDGWVPLALTAAEVAVIYLCPYCRSQVPARELRLAGSWQQGGVRVDTLRCARCGYEHRRAVAAAEISPAGRGE
jgi:hypothetical protein